MTLTTLQPKDAPALCERWKHYRPDPALDLYMQEITRRFDSSAIVSKEGKLMAYIGMQFNGSMAMLHVDPKCRGQRLGQIVLADLTKKLLAKGEIPYGLIPTKDTSFIATSSQKLGFTWIPQGSMAWIRYEPRSSVSPTIHLSTSQFADAGGADDPHRTNAGEGDREEKGTTCGLFLTALPLSCNECADISNDAVSTCTHLQVGIS